MQSSRTVVGVDIAKRVFQLHWVETETGELIGLRLTRAKFLEHFANRAPCLAARVAERIVGCGLAFLVERTDSSVLEWLEAL